LFNLLAQSFLTTAVKQMHRFGNAGPGGDELYANRRQDSSAALMIGVSRAQRSDHKTGIA